MHKTSNIDDGYHGSGSLIRRAVKKYGIENFAKETLFVFDNEEEMKAKEKELVTEEFCSREDTYNLCPGGHGGFGYINKVVGVDYETLIEQANRAKIRKYGEDFQSKISLEACSRLKREKRGWFSAEAETKRKKIGVEHCISNLKKAFSKEANAKRLESFKKIKHQSGENNSQFGKIWVTDGIKTLKIFKKELSFYEEKGYHRGRK